MASLKTLLMLALMPPFLLLAQEPDFYMPSLYRLESRARSTEPPLDANVSLYCDGDYISLVVEVKDPRIQIQGRNRFTDQVELWLALPQSAYPEDFEYQLHPQYIQAEESRNTQDRLGPRLFSTYAEHSNHLELAPFLADFDYPSSRQIQRELLSVPSPERLKKSEVHYGIVHYGLFTDKRPAVLYNSEYHQPLEEMLNIQMGDLQNGITYTVDFMDDGYIINAQIAPQALGFVQLPYMDQLRFMVEISGSDRQGERVYPQLTTSSKREAAKVHTFNQVYFSTPLRTTPSDEIPVEVFEKTQFYPIYMYADIGWIPTSVDTDVLVYQEQKTSSKLTEIKYFNQNIDYQRINQSDFVLESLKVVVNPVNELAYQREYLLVQNQVLSVQRTLTLDEISAAIDNDHFSFPDGKVGLIIKENRPHDPFGWGSCGDCLEETITIYRVEEWAKKELFSIHQANGENPYCIIQDQTYDGYLVTGFDWVKKGKMIVFRLDGLDFDNNKRVKASWSNNGSRLQIEPVD